MLAPILAEKAEELILYYMELHYLVLHGLINKIYLPLSIKARELGMNPRTAWKLIKFGRRVGMIDTKPFFEV